MSQPPKTNNCSPMRFIVCARNGREGPLPYVTDLDQYIPAAGDGCTIGLALSSIAAAIWSDMFIERLDRREFKALCDDTCRRVLCLLARDEDWWCPLAVADALEEGMECADRARSMVVPPFPRCGYEASRSCPPKGLMNTFSSVNICILSRHTRGW